MTRRQTDELVTTDDEEMSDAERILQIRESMEESRRQIAENLDEVRAGVRDAVDWRRWVREHPWEAVGLAAGTGFLLGFR